MITSLISVLTEIMDKLITSVIGVYVPYQLINIIIEFASATFVGENCWAISLCEASPPRLGKLEKISLSLFIQKRVKNMRLRVQKERRVPDIKALMFMLPPM